ncbi:aldehyde dehydrogenase family protein, partial [Burkholderia anthina]|uniref:aldehyde dehydrogenase family protein n=1 Tax=Burkholderia anthina TaxID=179879 RepID=UPI00158EF7FA
RIEGEIIPSDTPDENLFLHREPIGVVACLIPFNYPVYTLLRKIAPALIAGNTVVVRPSNHTPVPAFEIAKAVDDAVFPPGVVNILTMDHATAEALCTHPAVGMITLTGSVNAGRKVLDYCKANIAKPSLELGGKTPAIIEPDADLERAAAALVASKTTHCGQLCTAVERVYVHDGVYDRFVALLKAKMAAVRSGDRAADPSNMGPLVSASARARIHAMVERAVAAGATLETGGAIPDGPGFFYPATLLTGCRQDMEIVQEETFGPIMPVLRYTTIDAAIAFANDHQFGLSSVLYTENYRTAMKVANAIEAGELYVNRTPADPYQGFHAGWKRSGLGGDDGKHGMLEFTQTRLVVMKY